jgi:hypothetical protein
MAPIELPRLTAEQLAAALDKIEASQRGAARRLFGVDVRTVQRWIAGELDIPPAVALALALMIEHNLTAAEAEVIAAEFVATFGKRTRRK